jgi:hypothetical protein
MRIEGFLEELIEHRIVWKEETRKIQIERTGEDVYLYITGGALTSTGFEKMQKFLESENFYTPPQVYPPWLENFSLSYNVRTFTKNTGISSTNRYHFHLPLMFPQYYKQTEPNCLWLKRKKEEDGKE